MKRYLFSYGTLQPGRAPAEIAPEVRRLRRVGRGFVRGHIYDLGEYPGAVLSKGGPIIVGQIFELPDDPEILARLDEYEGYDPAHPEGSLFIRERRLVTFDDKKRKIYCWLYAYNKRHATAPSVGNGARNHRTR